MENEIKKFEELWGAFVTTFKGKLRGAIEAGELTPARASSILTESAMCWKGDYEPEGRWLNGLEKEDPAKGSRVRKILTMDMALIGEETANPGYLPQIAGAVGGGALGYGAASLFGMGTIATVATTVVPLGVGAVVGNIYADKKKRALREQLLDAYVGQLDKYYHSVLAILNA